jgi:hypothetical protein
MFGHQDNTAANDGQGPQDQDINKLIADLNNTPSAGGPAPAPSPVATEPVAAPYPGVTPVPVAPPISSPDPGVVATPPSTVPAPVNTVPAPVNTSPVSLSEKTEDKPIDLAELKTKALDELYPIVHKLDLSAEENFKTLMMMIQATDNKDLIGQAYETAEKIEDEAVRARALLDIVNEINYFTNHPSIDQ